MTLLSGRVGRGPASGARAHNHPPVACQHHPSLCSMMNVARCGELCSDVPSSSSVHGRTVSLGPSRPYPGRGMRAYQSRGITSDRSIRFHAIGHRDAGVDSLSATEEPVRTSSPSLAPLPDEDRPRRALDGFLRDFGEDLFQSDWTHAIESPPPPAGLPPPWWPQAEANPQQRTYRGPRLPSVASTRPTSTSRGTCSCAGHGR